MKEAYRRGAMRMVVVNCVAVTAIALAGVLLLWHGDEIGLYFLPVGILLSFFAAGASAWVMLIEILRR
jgi:hypothetical protein